MPDMGDALRMTPGSVEITGFWRRLFAFFLDGLLLGAFGAGIGLVAFDDLVALGTGVITSWLATFLVFGIGLSIVYLLLFNRRTRQSLHDLAVGAYVVSNKTAGTSNAGERIWPVHFGVVGLVLAAALILPYFMLRLDKSDTFADLLAVQQGLQQEPDVRHAAVYSNVYTHVSPDRGTTITHAISSDIFLARRVTDFDSLANRSARIILDRDPAAAQKDRIAITVIYGYDIGIASAWKRRSFAYSPEQWRKRFAEPPGTRPSATS
jgi:hypothetical protein